MNSWFVLLGHERTPEQLRLSTNRRARMYREKNADKVREMERARNPDRREYYRQRDKGRRAYLAMKQREYRARAHEG